MVIPMEIDCTGETPMVRGRKEKPKTPPQKPGPKRAAPQGFDATDLVSVGISLPRELYQLVKVVSMKRSKTPDQYQGRTSISAIITEILAPRAPDLRKE